MSKDTGLRIVETDGVYSWFVLVTIILCNFSSYGFIAGNSGVMSGYYPEMFEKEQATTNVISSIALGMLMFTGMYVMSTFCLIDFSSS